MEFKSLLDKIVKKKSLNANEAQYAFSSIMSGKCNDIEIAAFLVSLATKGETLNEILEAVKVLRSKSINIKSSKNLLDTCGTGGDGLGTFNISTTASFIASSNFITLFKLKLYFINILFSSSSPSSFINFENFDCDFFIVLDFTIYITSELK